MVGAARKRRRDAPPTTTDTISLPNDPDRRRVRCGASLRSPRSFSPRRAHADVNLRRQDRQAASYRAGRPALPAVLQGPLELDPAPAPPPGPSPVDAREHPYGSASTDPNVARFESLVARNARDHGLDPVLV
jgi:hypothetical protein